MMAENPGTGKVEGKTSGWLAEKDIVVDCGSNK